MQHSIYPPLDLKQALSAKRLLGLWRLLGGFQWIYLAAIISLALATAARSVTYLLLQYFVDDVLIQKKAATPFYLIALGFQSGCLSRRVHLYQR
jgi:ABC-type multidrug transport system fused ATPase/permease subunit